MSKITDIVQRNVLAALGIAFLVGAVLGLVVLGWGLWPVQWTNASPADLQEAWQRTYLSMAADSYALTGDAEIARERVNVLLTSNRTATQVAETLRSMADARAAADDAGGAARLLALASVLGTQVPVAPEPGSPIVTPPRPELPPLTRFLRICGLVILVLVILAGLLLLVYFLQSRTTAEPREEGRLATVGASTASESRPMAMPPAIAPQAEAEAPAVTPPPPGPAVIGPFVATYNLGDIDFDMSFGIESAGGDFLGECGLGMAETIGGGEVQRVTAFEVWLFDKTDIRTVSVVLASAHAHADAALRTKLASRGDIVLAQPGGVFAVRTSALKLQGRVLDMAYGGGDVPSQSYFTTFSVELTPVPVSGDAPEA